MSCAITTHKIFQPPFQMYSCQQVLVGKNPELIAILTFLCEQSHKLTNMGIYYARQLYFKCHKTLGKFDAGISL
ncbi:hypothetical protein [Okeania sp. SIO1I7]|uniref:hypothetical protein n=1 Tax=Okeania sp. SIO1I7 TaxID=2607772 RepID=UPI0025DFC0F9|nr:hypothetical protein [Okeania sp. SIO1I7]